MRELKWKPNTPQEHINTLAGFKLKEEDKVYLGGVLVNVEVTKSPKVGLSKTKSLCSNCGMVFFFPDKVAHITMKQTKIPLDIVFIRENEIVKIIEAEAMENEYKYPADCVVELNRGFCRDNHINIGAHLEVSKKLSDKEQLEYQEEIVSSAKRLLRHKNGGIIVKRSLGGELVKKGVKAASSFFGKTDINQVKQAVNTFVEKEGGDSARGVLNAFKARVQTPEGIRRASNLNYTKDDLARLQKIELKLDRSIPDHYQHSTNTITANPRVDKSVLNPIVRHEIEHANQNIRGVKMQPSNKIDESLKNLELKKEKEIDWSNLDEPTNAFDDFYNTAAISKVESRFLKGDTDKYIDMLKKEDNAKKYFTKTKGANEKATMLAEVQQWALDNKLIKDAYEEVTPERMKDIYNKYSKESNEGQFLRIFNIMEPTDSNFKLLSSNFNKLLTIGAGVGVTGAAVGSSQFKKGGSVFKPKSKKPKKRTLYLKNNADSGLQGLSFQTPGSREVEAKFKNAPMSKHKDGTKLEQLEDTEGIYLLDEEGEVQMVLQGGERIFSRIHTRKILELIKKLDESKDPNKSEALVEKLGVLVADIILTHDTQEEEYTED